MKGEVPSGEPGVFPFVRHRNHVIADHVEPLMVPNLLVWWTQRIRAVLPEPLLDIEKEALLGPQHPSECLAHHVGCIFAHTNRRYRPIELVGLTPSRLDDLREPRTARFLS